MRLLYLLLGIPAVSLLIRVQSAPLPVPDLPPSPSGPDLPVVTPPASSDITSAQCTHTFARPTDLPNPRPPVTYPAPAPNTICTSPPIVSDTYSLTVSPTSTVLTLDPGVPVPPTPPISDPTPQLTDAPIVPVTSSTPPTVDSSTPPVTTPPGFTAQSSSSTSIHTPAGASSTSQISASSVLPLPPPATGPLPTGPLEPVEFTPRKPSGARRLNVDHSSACIGWTVLILGAGTFII